MPLTPERRQAASRIARAALGRPPGERPALVDEACEGDEELRSEVEALLAAAARDDDSAAMPPEPRDVAPAAEAPGDDRSPEERRDPDPKTRLRAALAGRYTIERALGRGGMATVYLARDVRHKRPVALKVLDPHLGAVVGVARFTREIETVAALQHPHILPLFDSGAAGELLYYVMPYVVGESLREWIRRASGSLPAAETLRVVREVASALDHAHRHGVVHRDVKPENVLLDENGHALVADFGIARALHHVAGSVAGSATGHGPETLTGTGIVVGTPAYMSPEQALGEREVDGRSDVYSLACVAFEMLAGGPPFGGSTAEQIAQRFREPPPSLTARRPELPVEVDAVLTRALALEPDERHPTAVTFAEDLACALGVAPPSPERDTPSSPSVPLARADAPAHARGNASALPGARAASTSADVAVPPVRDDRQTGSRGRSYLTGAAWVVLAVAATWYAASRGEDTGLAATRIVIAPFGAADEELAVWREGLVDVLSRSLDGAGPLRTVSPTVAIRQWQGRPDPASAAELGRRTRAGLAVVGHLLPAGRDSVRVTATVVDVGREEVLGTVERQDSRANMARLADSLTLGILRELEERHALRADSHIRAMPVRSIEALKAFLQGEHLYRRSRWDSARVAYERALAHDGTFALALRRLGNVIAWQRLTTDSLAMAHLLRAGTLNHGLGPQDSLLVLADSLSAAATLSTGALEQWRLKRRLFATLAESVRHYPEAPGAWFALGEAGYHFGAGPVIGMPEREILAAFDRAIALDSTFAPAYIHAVELGFNLGGAPLGLRYARAYLALGPMEPAHRGVRLVEALLDPRRGDPVQRARLLDTVATSALVSARTILRRWPDSAEVAIDLGRLLAAGRPSEYRLFADTAFMRRRLAERLAFRGHLREAAEVAGGRDAAIVAELAFLDAVPADTAHALFTRWQRAGSAHARLALPWWSARRDRTALRAFEDDAARRAAEAATDDARATASYDTASVRAHLALAAGDTAAALARFSVLPDTLCTECYLDRLVRARLLAARGRGHEALVTLNEPLVAFLTPIEVVFALERGRVAVQLEERAVARQAFALVAAAWSNADPALRPLAAEAALAARRLGPRTRE